MLPQIGWVELTLILVIVAMLFGVGKLPEIFGAVGKGIREFRNEASVAEDKQGPPTSHNRQLRPRVKIRAFRLSRQGGKETGRHHLYTCLPVYLSTC